MNSDSSDASTWDSSLEPLNLQGQTTLVSDRVTLESSSRNDVYLDFAAESIEQNFTVHYPGSQSWYTLDTGFVSIVTCLASVYTNDSKLSLDGSSDTINYTSVNGSSVYLNKTLPLVYERGVIPSISYGLHIGSASETTTIAGSLVLGGYDRSRCLTEPIQSSNRTFTLIDIALGVADGGSPFTKAEALPIGGLLRLNGSRVGSIDTFPNPGVPYLHLPQDTCSAIADMLPVSFNESLGLYLWNTSDDAFQRITSSPSYISFNFSSGVGSVQRSVINVPFALLNLTLESPLVSVPTQYFPCSPYTPSDGSTFHLGRAFLQAAFLAQNWQAQRLMMAQAPGPGAALQQITIIASTDTDVTPMTNAPSWYSTWSSTLDALPKIPSGASSNATSTANPKHSDQISSGAIAGIVIGSLVVVAAVAAVVLVLRRRNRRLESREPDGLSDYPNEKTESPLSEADSIEWRNEMPNFELVEMSAAQSVKPGIRQFERDNTSLSVIEWPMELDSHSPIGELDGHSKPMDRPIAKGR